MADHDHQWYSATLFGDPDEWRYCTVCNRYERAIVYERDKMGDTTAQSPWMFAPKGFVSLKEN